VVGAVLHVTPPHPLILVRGKYSGAMRLGPNDPRARWFTLIVLAMSTLVISVDNTILNVALPTITETIGASSAQLQWIVDSYTLVFACLLLVAGALGDRFGRRRTLALGLIWFAVTAIYSALGNSPTDLIVGRGLMGIGAAFIFPSTLSILTTTFTDPAERGKAIGIWASVSSLSMVVGPISGGLLVDHLGWHSVFFVNVPFCALALVGTALYVPKGERDTTRRLDPLGSALSMLAVGTLLLAIIQGPEWGWRSGGVLAAAALAAAFFVAFIRWEQRVASPMLDIQIFRHPVFASAAVAVMLTFFASFGASLLTTVYFQSVQGFSALKTGLLMLPIAVAMFTLGPRVAGLVSRYGTRDVMTTGLSVLALGVLLHSSNTIMSSFALGLIPRFMLGVGIGLVMPPATMAIMSSLPPSHAGVGSAVNDTTRQTGGALGVAIIGSIVSSFYQSSFRAPAGLTGEAANQAGESIGRALVVASKLPPELGAQVTAAAKEAFIHSVRFGYWTAALIIALTVVFVRRRIPATGLVDHRLPAATPDPAVNADLS
jgi:EmrB/QacA subfamily drug resistance transporter